MIAASSCFTFSSAEDLQEDFMRNEALKAGPAVLEELATEVLSFNWKRAVASTRQPHSARE